MKKQVYFVLSISELESFIAQERAYRERIGSKSEHPCIVFTGKLVGQFSADGAEQVSSVKRE